MKRGRRLLGTEHRARPLLRRAADGSLRTADGELEIADVWAEQKRIRLREAIEREKQKAAKKKRRQQYGFFGAHAATRPAAKPGEPRAIEIKISLPKINLAPLVKRVQAIRPPHVSFKQWSAVVLLGVLALFVVVVPGMYHAVKNPPGNRAVSGATVGRPVGDNQPEFDTLLPRGKSIQQLGGWGRVSPPDKSPAFAYSDTLAGSHIVVTEQLMPDGGNSTLQDQLAQIAKQFNATEKLTAADGSYIFAGTASNGAESVVSAKRGLLILMRSSNGIEGRQWADYVASLQ